MDADADSRPRADGPSASAYNADRFDIYFACSADGGGAVYVVLLLIVAAAVAALPLVRIPLSIRAQGYVRARAETQVIHAPAAGTVVRLAPRAGDPVAAGDTLLVLARPELSSKRDALVARRAVLEVERADLIRLIGASPAGEPGSRSLSSVRYRQEWGAFSSEAEEIAARLSAAHREAARIAQLLQRSLVPVADADAARDRVDEVRLQATVHRQRTLAGWRSELASIEESLRTHAAEVAALDEEIRRLTVLAPVAGVVDELAAISAGAELRGGERIATVTPASELVAELYVTPAELDALLPGGEVRLQLQSQRFSDSGLQHGRILEIAPDLTRLGDRSVGWVLVRLAGTRTQGPGRSVALRRGMAVSAWMRSTPRTLWALLRDRRAVPATPARRRAPTRDELTG